MTAKSGFFNFNTKADSDTVYSKWLQLMAIDVAGRTTGTLKNYNMKKIKLKDLVGGESYLVETGFSFSPCGFDIAEYQSHDKSLVSQSNGDNIISFAKAVYTLPDESD